MIGRNSDDAAIEITLELDVLESLAARLEVWSAELSESERSHLLALLGLASSVIVGRTGTATEGDRTEVFAMTSPGFADALSGAANAVGDLGPAVAFDPARPHWALVGDENLLRTPGSGSGGRLRHRQGPDRR